MSQWETLEHRVMGNTEKILRVLEKYQVKATFFVLGWIAEKHPELVRAIDAQGHEVASHGYSHRMVTQMTPDEFEKDLARSLEVLSGIIHKPILGFRAPTFSITRKTQWALPILLKHGIRYDSSVYPIIHDRYGISDAPRRRYVIYQNARHELIEFPLSTIRIGKYNFPFGGGGYLRLYPLRLTRLLINKLQREQIPLIIYIHPWEFDTGQPRLPLGVIQRWRHYHNINRNMEKLEILLQENHFTYFKEVLN